MGRGGAYSGETTSIYDSRAQLEHQQSTPMIKITTTRITVNVELAIIKKNMSRVIKCVI